MGCEICGRNNCIKSFHSLEDQNKFDDIADKIKDRTRNQIINRINKLDGQYYDDDYYIKYDDIINAIEE